MPFRRLRRGMNHVFGALGADDYLNAGSRPNGQLEYAPIGATWAGRDTGVIAFETDDARTETYTEAYPEFQSRGLPWSIAVPVAKVGGPSHCSWGELEEMYANGAEMAVHTEGAANNDITTEDERVVYDILLDAKRQIEAKDMLVNRMLTAEKPDFVEHTDWESFAGQLVVGNFNSGSDQWFSSDATTYAQAGLTSGGFADTRRLNMGGRPEAELKRIVDRVEASGALVTFYDHPHGWGSADRTKFQNVLDYIEQKRDAGTLAVTTPTAARYWSGAFRDHHVNAFPSFESTASVATSAEVGAWYDTKATTTFSATARTGSQSVQLPPDAKLQYFFGWPGAATHCVIEGYARAAASGTTSTIQVGTNSIYDDYPDWGGLPVVGRRSVTVDDTWTKISSVFGRRRVETGGVWNVTVPGANDVLLDDVYIYPV